MKKKLLNLGVMLLALTMLFSVKVSAYTISSADIAITPSKNEYNAGSTIDFIVTLKDLNADTGLMAMGAYVNYDSNLLTLNTSAQGLSGWDSATISSSTNRFVTTRMEHSKNNEDILKISFTAKDVSENTKTSISLKKIELSNGAEYDISEVKSTEITIMPKSSTPPSDNPSNPDNEDNPSKPDNGDNPSKPGTENDNSKEDDKNKNNNNSVNDGNVNNSTNNGNSSNSSSSEKNSESKNNESTSSNKIPNLGSNPYIKITILIVAIIALILYIRLKLVNLKLMKQINMNESDSKKDDTDSKEDK